MHTMNSLMALFDQKVHLSQDYWRTLLLLLLFANAGIAAQSLMCAIQMLYH